MKPPCKDCKDRYVGCHSKCKDYLTYKQHLKEQAESKEALRIKEAKDYVWESYRRYEKNRF